MNTQNSSSSATKISAQYLPFARKYRPKDFSELIGQSVLRETISHAIAQGRLAQSYLLTGIRGIGKTSTARIIAKTINCTNLDKTAKILTPCGKCNNCQSCQMGNNPDIMEIDAASHTSVDEIRRIIESSEYMPLQSQYKCFIIDEVHMLSKSAFNALLKIIEEPPRYVIFILATTEVQKIPLTVISRCQRFDLRRLSFDETANMIKYIAQDQNLSISEEAIKMIAAKAEGSARDATCLLDQAASYLANTDTDIIDQKLMSQMLSCASLDHVVTLVEYIIKGHVEESIKLLNNLYQTSTNIASLSESLADFFAELTKYKLMPTYNNPLYSYIDSKITDILLSIDAQQISLYWQIFSSATSQMKQSHNQLLTLEMTILKAQCLTNMPPLAEILSTEATYNNVAEGVLEKTELGETKLDSTSTDSSRLDIFDFLKFCHGQNELDCYYYLLNEVEFVSLDKNLLSLKGSNNPIMQNKVKVLLQKWSKMDFAIKVDNDEINSTLKNQLIDDITTSENFTAIKKQFPSANISDIILSDTKKR